MAALTGPLTPLCFIRVFARFLNKTQHSTEGCYGFIFRLFLTGITGNYLAQKNSSANPRNSSRSSGRGFESQRELHLLRACFIGWSLPLQHFLLPPPQEPNLCSQKDAVSSRCPAPGWTRLVWRLRLHIPCFGPMSSSWKFS